MSILKKLIVWIINCIPEKYLEYLIDNYQYELKEKEKEEEEDYGDVIDIPYIKRVVCEFRDDENSPGLIKFITHTESTMTLIQLDILINCLLGDDKYQDEITEQLDLDPNFVDDIMILKKSYKMSQIPKEETIEKLSSFGSDLLMNYYGKEFFEED
jgi:hypothetical protein